MKQREKHMTTLNEHDKSNSAENRPYGELTLDELESASGGLGTVIPSMYKKGDGNIVAAFYAGLCMGLMGL